MALTRQQDVSSQPGVFDPRTPEGIWAKKKAPVERALRLTRWGMIWEQVARAFWPLATVLALVLAALALGLVQAVPLPLLPWLAGGALAVLVGLAVRGGMRFRSVPVAEAVERLDRSLPGRPLAALSDRAVLGGEGALWQAHLAQMRSRAAAARTVPPDAGLARRDPMALRLAGLLALAMAMVFGGVGQIGQGFEAIAATLSRPVAPDAPFAGPGWEGWAEPPAYTRRPTIYLNGLAPGQGLDLPKGSAVSFRFYGGGSAFEQDIGPATSGDPQAPGFTAERSGVIAVAGRRFDVRVLPDDPPVIRAGSAPVRRADGRTVLDFTASDDHGVASGEAVVALALDAVDRRFGLAIDPEPRAPVELALPLPRGDRRDVRSRLAEDLSRHPWANLPVSLSLRAVDGIGQAGESAALRTSLPGRRFFDPLAATLIEIRRDLLWSRANAARSAEILRAVTWKPEGFVQEPLYRQLRGAVGLLEGAPLTGKARDDLAEALWQAAVQLEDGGLSDALERMRQAQQKLSEAIRNGASPDEIQRLMAELKEATDGYTRMLARRDDQDPSDRFAKDQPGQQITGDQIQRMMDEIERLMNEGRMAEAQELLEQFNRMMENLQVRQGQGGQGGEGGQQGSSGNESMNRLADTLREQQRLSDEAFRDMQDQFGKGRSGAPSPGAEDLAGRQRQLREELGRQQGLLPRQGSLDGDAARRRLDQAGRAMEDAEQALRQGDSGAALQRQADAIESLREGMRALGDMLDGQQDRQAREGQQGQDGQPSGTGERGGTDGMPRDQRLALDPLGRQRDGTGSGASGGDPLEGDVDPIRRARDLLDEIRRRSGEPARTGAERDYLGRLLDRF